MVSPPLPMEDQTDEDFFDNLVDDEVDDVGSVPSFLNNVGSSDEKAFANLSIDEGVDVVDGSGNVDRVEGDCSENGGNDDVGTCSIDDNKVEGFGAEGSGGVTGFPETVDRESSDHGVGGVSESDPRMGGNVADTGAGIKEVKWCAYSGNAQEVSFSDYFNQIGDDADDPFADLDDSPTIPPGTLDGGLTVPSGTLDGGLMVPSGTLDGGLMVPSGTLDGGLMVPSATLDGGLAVPSATLDGGLAVPSATLDGGLTVPSGTLDGGLTVPSGTLDGGLTVPSATFDGFTAASGILDGVSSNQPTCSSSPSIGQSGEGLDHTSSMDYTTEVPDQYSIQYWESLYPGWKYDLNTGMWNQVDGFNEMVNNAESNNAIVQPTWEGAVVNSTPDAHYLQHTAQSVCGSISEESTAGTLSYWNQAAYGNIQYPAHMVFDPQYPGWYYDTIALEWRSLESYFSAINQPDSMDQTQELPRESANTVNYFPEPNMPYGQGQQVNNYSFQPDQPVNSRDSGKDTVNVHPGQSNGFNYTESAQYGNGIRTNGVVNYSSTHGALAAPYVNSVSYEQPRQVFDSNNGFNRVQGLGVGNTGIQNFAPAEYSPQHINHSNEIDRRLSATGFTDSNVQSFTQQPRQFQSPDGRPSHALVSFGFGGKLIVMKDQGALHTQPAYNGPDSAGGVINVLNVMEVAMSKNDGSDVGVGDFDYIRILCHQAFSGPLFSGNVGSKELNKWIDDRIANGNVPDADYKKGEVQKMLLSLLKIACQYYGKLRSAYGTDHGAKDNDCPESALAKLFSSSKRNSTQFSAAPHCLQNMASEQQIQATAEEVQTLLVSGRRMEALQCAQNGHLWGPAIVIATLLGEQFYGETVKQMALHQLVAGSPLRTLCLLIAGQPAEVFSNTISSDPQKGANVSQTSSVGPGCMLDDWEDNLAIISANRTKGDELVITHLGDCIWRERGEVMAAHICYLVAEANIESYSESARLCLVGADHLKYPRTYASPQAIQRTELYEYAKVLGNSQFVLLPFQPYKFLYACMLAEVGKLSDSLKYCQAILKSLKTGRSPEVDAWRHMVSSFEERIKIHQQGGYATNFSRAKLVGKLLHLFDNTAHRVVGGLPPPTPSASLSNGQHSEHDHQSRGPRVSTSQSTMAMSSLMTSSSSEGNNLKALHNRSMSEPDFGRTPRKDDSPKSSSSSPHGNSSHSGSSSRFGRFGSQILHKTVSLVLGSRSDRQAKLGETNKFYYDEKLKRWVEEGVEPQAEEMTLAPPPTSTAFMNGMPGHERKYESPNTAIHANGDPEYKQPNSNGMSAELPPIPSGLNHFSARGRMGVRARYVDTFNKGAGTPANSFQSPSPLVPAMKPAVGTPKIFIPTPSSGGQELDSSQSTQQNVVTDKDNITSNNSHDSFSSPQMLTPISTIPRHPSMDKGMGSTISSNGQLPANARRTLSWGGGLDLPNHTSTGETKSSAEVPGFPLSA